MNLYKIKKYCIYFIFILNLGILNIYQNIFATAQRFSICITVFLFIIFLLEKGNKKGLSFQVSLIVILFIIFFLFEIFRSGIAINSYLTFGDKVYLMSPFLLTLLYFPMVDVIKVNRVSFLKGVFSTNPVGTLESNVLGTKNLLDFLKEKNRNGIFLLLSSVEVYGDSRGDVDSFTEDYEGKLNWNSLRACYSESKRLCETMCQAYIQQYGISSKIVRLSRVYGPTMLMSDSKVMSQFIKNALNRENIVLKSSGNQYFSYTYVTDAVAGILTVMLNGDTGEAYNIVSKNSNVHLRELAKQISNFVGVKVIFDLPNETEKRGYSKSSVAILDDTKVQKIGYKSQVSLKQGVRDTLDFLKKVKNTNRVI